MKRKHHEIHLPLIACITLGIITVAVLGYNTPPNTVSAASTPATCSAYIVTDSGNDIEKFFRVDMANKVVYPLAASYAGDDLFEALDIDPQTNIIYTIAQKNYAPGPGRLYTVDSATGNITLVGNTGFTAIESLSFKPDGTLWGWDRTKGLVSINKTTGAGTLVYSKSQTISGIAWNTAGNLLYMSEEDGNLYTFNPSTNTVTLIASNLPPEADGLEMRNDGLLMSGYKGSDNKLHIYAYNVTSKTIVENVAITTAYNDAESIAWPNSCGTPTNPTTPTPSPSATPATPSPTPVSTTPACSPNCSNKQVGDISFGTFAEATSNLIQNQSYWLRLTVNGEGLQSSVIKVKEKVNTSYFKILDPVLDTTFKITKGSPENSIHASICADANSDTVPDCISNIAKTGSNITSMDITLDSVTAADKRYIYLKIVPIQYGSGVTVDDTTYSTVQYTTVSKNITLAQDTVTIQSTQPYFQFLTGDIFTNSAITAYMPSGSYFASQNEPVVFHTGAANYGSGSVSPTAHEITGYSMSSTMSYDKFYEMYKSYITPLDITGKSSLTSSGYYIHNPSTASKDLVINSDWIYDTSSPRQHVIFVNGNLYINGNISVAQDGRNSLVFIVKDNIGINPSINDAANKKVQGVYLADGKIDTVCNGTFDSTAQRCAPTITSGTAAELNSTLSLEGMFYANEGFNLDRKGTGSNPGEKFTFFPAYLFGTTQAIGQNNYIWIENTD